jgi:hypothetical protein
MTDSQFGDGKTKKQAAITTAYSHEKTFLCWIAAQKVSKLYEDKDSVQFRGKEG